MNLIRKECIKSELNNTKNGQHLRVAVEDPCDTSVNLILEKSVH